MLKTLKRKIALVAVATLGAGGLSIVAAPVANAADVTATVTATVSPIRMSFTGAAADSVPLGKITFTLPAALEDDKLAVADTVSTLTVLSAPTSSAVVEINNIGGTSDDATDSLAITNGQTGAKTTALGADLAEGAEVTATIRLSANPAAGTYSGRLVLYDDGTAAGDKDTITINWSFTTAGAPATISLAKTAVSLPAVTSTLTLKNASLTSNVATLTTTTEHGFTVGNQVVIAGLANETVDRSPINGTYTIASVPTATTFTVAKTNANLAAKGTDLAAGTAQSLVAQSDITVSLKDASGKATQPATGDTIAVAIGDSTNIAINATGLASSYTITDADLADGSHDIRVGSVTATADVETLTFTPAGVLGSTGVTAVTATATTVAYGAVTNVKTKLISPSSSSVVLDNTTTAQSDYSVDPGTSTFIAETSGLEIGKAYRIGIKVSSGGGGNTPAGTYSVAGSTAAAWTNGTIAYSYGIADSTGKVQTILVFTTRMDTTTAADKFEINASTANADFVDTTDLLVTASDSAYTITLSSPATNPSVAVTASAIDVAGTIADQYGNPFGGATVTVSGAQTLSAGTATALAGQAVTDATGKFTLKLAAANALTTKVDLTINASRGGSSAATKTSAVNFNAGGAATALTWAGLGDEDSATTATKLPLIVVPFDGTMTGAVSDELWDVATAKAEGDADANNDECWALEVNTTPLAQVTFTGSEGVLFSKTTCIGQKVSDATMVSTVTVASKTLDATPNSVWITSKKVGLNTVTMTSGSVTKTIKFYAQNFFTAATKGEAARDIVLDSATKTLSGGEIGFVTATVVDTFGNPVAQAAAASTVKASITGAALLDGPSLSKSGLVSDADGKITLGIIAGNAAGTATLTVTGVNVAGSQFGALVGAVTSTTTAGTDATFKASANVKTATITVSAASAAANPAIDAVKADVKAVSDTVATLSKAVTTIQSSVTELTSSFSAQIKSLSSAIAKISRAIAALSKKIK